MHRHEYIAVSNSYSLVNYLQYLSNSTEATHPIIACPTSHLPYLSSLTICILGGSGAQMLVRHALRLPQTNH